MLKDNKGNNKITELRTILQRESQNSQILFVLLLYKIIVRENRRGYKKWTIPRYWQHWEHNTQDQDKQGTKHTTLKSKKQTIKQYCLAKNTLLVPEDNTDMA